MWVDIGSMFEERDLDILTISETKLKGIEEMVWQCLGDKVMDWCVGKN